jgi:hypothetical protein
MHHFCIIIITSALLSVSPAWAQESSAEQASPCVAAPIFHCMQHLEGGDSIGHFGYDLQCPEDAQAEAEIFININDDNMFSPGQKDRGQPKVFVSGEHIDEFEVDFSMVEAKDGSVIQWSVMGQTTTVDFSKTKDGFLDCSSLAQ